ncbi:hypothetical protein IFM89_002898 [Coptis chinensis]|uniref:H15 domain-containing protein n=1 Tax=Coptis chinensis TaxID=261450 RepID=A0A835ILR9_9MAGN|nr:hypothetical protein IFM89_002898 [Coptis chinensis]
MAVKGEVKSTTMAKQVKEKKVAKAAAPKEKKSTPSHPPYFQMIKEALLALKEKGGSSPYAIAKYMEEKHKEVLPANFKKMLAVQLKNNVVKGTLVKVKASFKLSDAAKKVSKPDVKPAEPVKKKAVSKAKASVPAVTEKKVVKKQPVKKTEKKVKKVGTPVKKNKKAAAVKPKQPKSIKSPAAKKARKA